MLIRKILKYLKVQVLRGIVDTLKTYLKAFKHTITILKSETKGHNLLLQDAAQHTETLRLPAVAVGKRDRDTPSGGDYMGGN